MVLKLFLAVVIIFSIIIFFKYKKNENSIGTGLVHSLRFLLLTIFAVLMGYMTVNSIHVYITYPTYKAKVIKVDTFTHDGTTMYNATYGLYTNKGLKKVKSSTSSSTVIYKNDIKNIKYKNGELFEDSFITFIFEIYTLIGISGLLLFTINYIMYIFDKKIQNFNFYIVVWLSILVVLFLAGIFIALGNVFYETLITTQENRTLKLFASAFIMLIILMPFYAIYDALRKKLKSTNKKVLKTKTSKNTETKTSKYIELKDDTKTYMYAQGFFASLFIFITYTISYEKNKLMFFIFFMVSLYLIYLTIRLYININKFGNISLIYNKHSTKVGRKLEAYFSIHTNDILDNSKYTITLENRYIEETRGYNNKKETQSIIAWKSSVEAVAKIDSGYIIINFRIKIDRFKDLYDDSTWTIILDSNVDGINLNREFKIDIEH